MEFLFHTKLILELSVTVIPLIILKKFDPEPDLCPANIKLSAKIPLLEKCSLSLKHKKEHFDVSYIIVDSKSVPILGLATSESLNLIKRISAVNKSDELFLSEFLNVNKAIKREHLPNVRGILFFRTRLQFRLLVN